jgi:uncharacterized membrane protein YhhN
VRDRYELWGWILFLLCAVVFIVAGVRDRDALMVVGSVAFLVACVLFLLTHARR